MQSPTATSPTLPDLLRRFVPARFRAKLRFGFSAVSLETNDPAILDAFRDWHSTTSAQYEREYETGAAIASHQVLCRLIRDDDVHVSLADQTIINHGAVTLVSMGPACLITIDRETLELFAFLGTAVDAETLRTSVLPLLRELARISSPEIAECSRPEHSFASIAGRDA